MTTTEFGTDTIANTTELFEDFSGNSVAPTALYDSPTILDFKLNPKGLIRVAERLIKLSRNNTDEKGDYRRIKIFAKLNKPVQFNRGSQGPNEQDTRLCYMLNAYNPNNTAGTPTAFTFSHSYVTSVYFTDS